MLFLFKKHSTHQNTLIGKFEPRRSIDELYSIKSKNKYIYIFFRINANENSQDHRQIENMIMEQMVVAETMKAQAIKLKY